MMLGEDLRAGSRIQVPKRVFSICDLRFAIEATVKSKIKNRKSLVFSICDLRFAIEATVKSKIKNQKSKILSSSSQRGPDRLEFKYPKEYFRFAICDLRL